MHRRRIHPRSVTDRADRYLGIVLWARRRYSRDGFLITFKGLAPSAYTRTERAAWNAYMSHEGLS